MYVGLRMQESGSNFYQAGGLVGWLTGLKWNLESLEMMRCCFLLKKCTFVLRINELLELYPVVPSD